MTAKNHARNSHHVIPGDAAGLYLRPLQSLAPDLEVEKSNSELGQKGTISRLHGIGIGSRGGVTRSAESSARGSVDELASRRRARAARACDEEGSA